MQIPTFFAPLGKSTSRGASVVTDSCVFCGCVGELTEEDAFPKWIARELLPIGSVFRISSFRGDGGVLVSEGDIRSKLLGTPVKCVCDRCNNRWMSQMENKIKTMLLPMFYGKGTTLDRNGQRKIVAWAIKTSYMLIYAQNAEFSVHPDWRTLMYDGRRIPPTARLWLAAYGGDVMPAQSDVKHVTLTSREVDAQRSISGNLVTFSVVHLAFQLWLPDHPGPSPMEYDPPLGHTSYMTQIWPCREKLVGWPTPGVLDTRGFGLLCRNFG